MRNISFALTTEQIRNRTKTVTRRMGPSWKDLPPNTKLQPIRKGQGLKKGEKVTRISTPIITVDVRSEPLARLVSDPDYGREEMVREGFPGMDPLEFIVRYFTKPHRCSIHYSVTRIEFTYVD